MSDNDYPYPPEPRVTFPDHPWPKGPWDDEPDLETWVEPETGYRCCAMRHHYFGNWKGYVRVPPKSLLVGVERTDRITVPPGWNQKRLIIGSDVAVIDEIFDPGNDDNRRPLSLLLAVHGGLAFADGPWFGFDCAHADDLIPGMGAMMMMPKWVLRDLSYRTLEFVRHEANQLAWQLKELGEAMAAVADQQLAEERK
jgi:hypothetical protein